MPAPRRNIELKAHDLDPSRTTARCLELGAALQGTLSQRDTYFEVPFGGLKLREETPGAPHLIQWERGGAAGQRESRYRTVAIADGATLRLALEAALGVLTVVTKRRRLFLWQDVRIHLDEVDGLGAFIELEAVAAPSSDLERERALVVQLRGALEIHDQQLLEEGYAAQLMARGR